MMMRIRWILPLARPLLAAGCIALVAACAKDVITSIEANTAKDLTAFSFTVLKNPSISPVDAVGVITGREISVSVPHSATKNSLIATFTTTGASVAVAGVPQVSGNSVNNHTIPVIYTVTAKDGTKKDYTVTVSSNGKAITSFGFGLSGEVDAINEADHTVSVTVPFGTNVANLTAIFEISGVSANVGGVVQASGTTANDFTLPVTYTVTAEDNTTQTYVVTVTVPLPGTTKAITAFSIDALDSMTCTINEFAHTITATTPTHFTDRSSLVAVFTTNGVEVKVGSTVQQSGVTSNNFSAAVTYTVKAEDGSTQDYIVTISLALDIRKDLSTFGIQTPSATGTITQGNQTIAVTMPAGTALTSLVATFTTNGDGTSVTIGAATQTSGVTANDFTSPVTYTVHAQDSSTKSYTVYLHAAQAMVSVPAGSSFSMGWDTPALEDAAPSHLVSSISAFSMGTTEVAWSIWKSVIDWATAHGYSFSNTGKKGSDASSTAADPVTLVDWFDAVKWCNALSEKEGLAPVYTTDGSTVYRMGEPSTITNANTIWANAGYRLPTEAEWEFAARYQNGSAWTAGDQHSGYNLDSVLGNCGWYTVNSSYVTHPVGQKTGNSRGIYDLNGNVWEWCWDWYGTYTTASPYTDPNTRGPDAGTNRITRGGGWFTSNLAWLNTARRWYKAPTATTVGTSGAALNGDLGFRILKK